MPQAESFNEDVDKISEARLAFLIGTTQKALERKRERKIIPEGVWSKIDGRIIYSKRRYDEWVESLWTDRAALRSSATRSASVSHGMVSVGVKPLPIRQPRKGSPRQAVYELK
ncbi:hypothetical protein SAMN05216189_105327 [Pseudomonas delhiensis]|uniref:Uncharacterized protein n=1 Tax=Pseudomonas delhiensis TaxID=366289 RepID=A0A239NKR6_9PSED|nr:hypothetical protein [Pseudomonas delhiensis]SDK82344.1 hypothetical protein SAMN05216189_105327 [Pseudomonas delhiensis]SNT55053.1 hypothetical protein SAMN06295949_15013 [Pseudomonas delhiensis]